MEPHTRIKAWDELTQFRWTSITVITPRREGLNWFHFDYQPRFQVRQVKDHQSYIPVFVGCLTIPSSSQKHQFRNNSSIKCKVVWQINIDTKQTQEKKLHRKNQGCNFLGGSFTNRDYVRALIKFIRERQPQHLKRWFFFQNRATHFHISDTGVFRPVKRLSFPSNEINKPLIVPVQVSRWSDSSSEANYRCFHRLNAWSHLD